MRGFGIAGTPSYDELDTSRNSQHGMRKVERKSQELLLLFMVLDQIVVAGSGNNV